MGRLERGRHIQVDVARNEVAGTNAGYSRVDSLRARVPDSNRDVLFPGTVVIFDKKNTKPISGCSSNSRRVTRVSGEGNSRTAET